MTKKILKVFSIIISILVLIIVATICPIDRTPYTQMPYYQEMITRLDSVKIEGDHSVKVGWAKTNITPDHKLPLVSYGIKKDFESVRDSIFCRAFVFQTEKGKSAIVSLDLLIFPPALEKRILEQLKDDHYDRGQLFLSATHTHNSIGGWAPGFAGKFFAGGYDEKVIEELALKIEQTLLRAEQNISVCRYNFDSKNASSAVINRLGIKGSTTDPWFRCIYFENEKNQKAVLTSFSAHANCLSSKDHFLSCDYPGELVRKIEAEGKINFAAFCAGPVGSMGPGLSDKKGADLAAALGKLLFEKVSFPDSLQKVESIASEFIPLSLRDPQFKISQNWRVRPYLFNWAFGDQNPGISILKMDKVLIIGTPCDFSGELIKPLQERAKKKGLELMITSFNGGYIGYITRDEYYDLEKAETREMNWFGPYNAAYFSEVISKIIEKL